MKLKDLRLYNYIDQLTKTKNSIDQENLISRNLIKKKYKQLELGLKNKVTEKQSVSYLEAEIELKLAYINMLIALKENNIYAYQNADMLFEKKELARQASDIFRLSYTDAMKKESLQDADLKKYNSYKDLHIKDDILPEKINQKYKKQLNLFIKELDTIIEQNSYSRKNQIKLQALYLNMKTAYKTLENPIEKAILDEELSLNFNPNREDLFEEKNIAELTYVPQKSLTDPITKEKYKPIYFLHNSRYDEIIIEPLAEVGFGKYRQSDGKLTFQSPYALKEYCIIKKYENDELAQARRKEVEKGNTQSEWDDFFDGEKFIVYGNIDYAVLTNAQENSEYSRYNMDVLLSNINLETAIEHNGGFIGNIARDSETNDYIVFYDQDKLCAAKKIQEIRKKTKIDRPIRIALDANDIFQGDER